MPGRRLVLSRVDMWQRYSMWKRFQSLKSVTLMIPSSFESIRCSLMIESEYMIVETKCWARKKRDSQFKFPQDDIECRSRVSMLFRRLEDDKAS